MGSFRMGMPLKLNLNLIMRPQKMFTCFVRKILIPEVGKIQNFTLILQDKQFNKHELKTQKCIFLTQTIFRTLGNQDKNLEFFPPKIGISQT